MYNTDHVPDASFFVTLTVNFICKRLQLNATDA